MDPLIERALGALRATAVDGRLLALKRLIYILYSWRLFGGDDPAEPRAWTDTLLRDEQSTLSLMRAMTATFHSVGMSFGDMGDRVATPHIQRLAKDDMDIVDSASFRAALERSRDEGRPNADSVKAVNDFLSAWDSKRARRHK